MTPPPLPLSVEGTMKNELYIIRIDLTKNSFLKVQFYQIKYVKNVYRSCIIIFRFT
jgi:hypothetical protein